MAFWLDFSQTTADRRAHRPGSSPFEECNKYASLSGYIQALWEIIGRHFGEMADAVGSRAFQDVGEEAGGHAWQLR